jgi:hypothetical protein
MVMTILLISAGLGFLVFAAVAIVAVGTQEAASNVRVCSPPWDREGDAGRQRARRALSSRALFHF